MNNMEKAKIILAKKSCSVAAVTESGESYFDTGRSVRPLYRIYLEHGEGLAGASVADRVIGKAAAVILAAAGVKEAFGFVMSKDGLRVLTENGIDAQYETLAERIDNINKTDMCPMEKTVADSDDIWECIKRIDAFIKKVDFK